MSTLNELIKKFCPQGVEYVRLGDLCILNRYKQLGAEELKSLKTNNGDIHLLPSSRDFDWITNKQLAGNLICKGEVFTLGRARYANPKYVNGYFISSNNIIIESKNREKISTKYLYYFVISNEKRIYVETSTYPKFDKPSFNMLKIPLPPLRVQEEIVKILDKFTDLENELENELRMRKMQFNAYCDKLLTFDNGVRFEKLGDVCLLNRYKQLSAEKLKSLKTNNGDIHLLPSSRNFDWITTKQLAGNLVCHGEVFTIGRANFANPKYVDGYFISSNNIIIESKNKQKLSTKYLYYFVISNEKHIYIETPTYPKFDASSFNTLTIPVPPLEKQKEIVEKLDKFNEMCNEISEGLPLEIELRKKQYEFYRNKLLSFDKKAS